MSFLPHTERKAKSRWQQYMRTLPIIILLLTKSVFGQINYCECSHSLFRDINQVGLLFNPVKISELSIVSATISLLKDTSNNPIYTITFDKKGNILFIKEAYNNSSTVISFVRNKFGKLEETKFDYLDSNGTKQMLGSFAWKYFYQNNALVKEIQVYLGKNGYQPDSNSGHIITYNYKNENLTVKKTTYNSNCNNCKTTNYYNNIYTFKSNQKERYKITSNDSVSTIIQILDENENKIKEYAPDSKGKPYYVITHNFDKSNKLKTIELKGGNGECVERNGYNEEIIYNSAELPIEFKHVFDNIKCVLKFEYNK